MTPTLDPTPIPIQDHEGPADPRPAWERVAYIWLAREVDAGQPLDPTELAREVSVAPGFAGDLLRVLRAQQDRDPGLAELRARLVRDRITDAYVTRELEGGQRLDPKDLAGEVGITATVARQWLHTLRAGNQTDRRLVSLRGVAVSHGQPTPEQLQALQAAYADGGRPQLEDPRPAEWALERIEQLYRDREAANGRPLDAAETARQVGVSEHYVRGTLLALRGGTLEQRPVETDALPETSFQERDIRGEDGPVEAHTPVARSSGEVYRLIHSAALKPKRTGQPGGLHVQKTGDAGAGQSKPAEMRILGGGEIGE
jgi:hypothetical protein